MGFFCKRWVAGLLAYCCVAGFVGAEESVSERFVFTHADASIVLAKYSGLFDRYVDAEASITGCVAFFNKMGIYFGLRDVINGAEFKRSDCARVLGQIELILSGDAEYTVGKVKLPKGVDSWEGFCILNDIQVDAGYRVMVNSLQFKDE